MRSILLLVCSLCVLYGFRHLWNQRPLHRPPGILAHEEPEQTMLPAEAKPILVQGEVIQPLADYRIRARLLRQEPYDFDHGADLSPIDICVGWGPMSDSQILDQLKISQNGRYCTYAWQGEPPAPPQILAEHMANMHIIPANNGIRAQLEELRPGQILTLQGQLVRVDGRQGEEWKSSLSRKDTGPGACEVMLVQMLQSQN